MNAHQLERDWSSLRRQATTGQDTDLQCVRKYIQSGERKRRGNRGGFTNGVRLLKVGDVAVRQLLPHHLTRFHRHFVGSVTDSY